MSSWRNIDDRKKDILILGIGPTQGLEHTLMAGKLYSINFTKENTTFSSTMEQTVICLLMVKKFTNLQWKVMKLFHMSCA